MEDELDKLIHAYEKALSRLEEAIASELQPSEDKLRKLDQATTSSFLALMSAEPGSKAAHLRRLNFLLTQIKKTGDLSGMMAQMIEKVREDANSATSDERIFPINVLHLNTASNDETEHLTELAYTSKSTREFSESEIKDLCVKASASNCENGITGALFYNPKFGKFFQILEGAKPAILNLMVAIQKDPRHTDIRLCFMNPIEERSFDDWAMVESTLPEILELVSDVDGIDPWFRKKFRLDNVIDLSNRQNWMVEKIKKHYRSAV